MGRRVKKDIQTIRASQKLLAEQIDELKRIVSVIRKSGDNGHLEDVAKMWMSLAKDLKKQGESIMICALEVKQVVAQEPKPKQDFKSKLTDDEIRQLLPIINEYVFVKAQTTESVKEWLSCCNKKPLQVKSNGLLAFLLNVLQAYNFICRNCQKVASDNKTFVSMRGKVLNQKDLSKSQSLLAHNIGYKKVDRDIYALNTPIYNKVKELSWKRNYNLS